MTTETHLIIYNLVRQCQKDDVKINTSVLDKSLFCINIKIETKHSKFIKMTTQAVFNDLQSVI